jgi:diaminopropionate ammonia-lyase
MRDRGEMVGYRAFVPQNTLGALPRHLSTLVSKGDIKRAYAEITSWPDYEPTPLFVLPDLARRYRVGQVMCKWEGARFDVGSFKPLGPSYALVQHLRRRLAAQGIAARGADILAGHFQDSFVGLTACAATSGNHGRALAWAASKAGIACRIYVPCGVSRNRRDAIANLGADVVVVNGSYDDAAAAAAQSGDILIAGYSLTGDPTIPIDTMIGYSVLAEETIVQRDSVPTHVFVAGGSGRLGAAVLASYWHHYGSNRPRVVMVEPLESACLLESAEHHYPVSATGSGKTIMDGLVVVRPSALAWAFLSAGAYAFLAISDATAKAEIVVASRGYGKDPSIPIGETGIAAWAGLAIAARTSALRRDLALDSKSRPLIVACEGPTDPEIHRSLMSAGPRSAVSD